MATLYLHVGHGKTGSSWIQSVLRLNREILRQYDIIYGRGPDYNVTTNHRITSGNGPFLFNSREKFESILANSGYETSKSLLFSSEFMFKQFILNNVAEFIEDVAHQFGFDRVEILLFIRDPISTVLSAWKQRVKRGGFYHISLDNLHENEQIGLDRVDFVEKFIQEVKRCNAVNLTVRNYSQCKNHLAVEVATWLNLPANVLQTHTISPVNRAPSYSELVLQTEINRILGKSGKILSDPLCEQLPDVISEKLLPPLEVQEKIWEKVKPVVERINLHLAPEHQYRCDIQPPVPLPDSLCFSHDQIRVIAASLGGEISRLRQTVAGSELQIRSLTDEIQTLKKSQELAGNSNDTQQNNAARLKNVKKRVLSFFKHWHG
jgi:hypothetical protein